MTKMNPLLISLIKDDPRNLDSLAVDMSRRTGRSTAIALDLLAKCIKHPYQQFQVEDHFNTRASNEILWNTLKQMVSTLKLQCFVFEKDYDKFYIAMKV